MTVEVLHGDCREILKTIADCSIDSVVTDPPYALVSIGKRFGSPDARLPNNGGPMANQYNRVARGFMGKEWDTGETAFDPAFWAEVLRVLKPGGHIVAFSGTRTYHRMTCAIEDSGFEIRDQIGWIYGSGFPKSHDVSKGIDRIAGRIGKATEDIKQQLRLAHEASGQTLLQLNEICGFEASGYFRQSSTWATVLPSADKWPILRDALNLPKSIDALFSEAAREVIGKSQWDNSAKHFIPGEDHTVRVNLDLTAPATDEAIQWQGWGTALKPAWEPICLARKPLIGTVAANVMEHGTGAINVDGCRIGTTVETWPKSRSYAPGQMQPGHNGETQLTGDSPAGRWPANIIHDGSEEVLAGFPESVSSGGQGAASLKSASPHFESYRTDAQERKYLGANAGGLGDSGSAARFFYTAKADAEDRFGSKHPTVKPVDLMQWLVRLVTPKGGTVLDPFAGTGTTGEACFREGMNCVLIEREEEYLKDIRVRMAHAADGPVAREHARMKHSGKTAPHESMPLFGANTL